MVEKNKNIYTNGEYLRKNPTWGSEDSEWKAIEINRLIKKNNLLPESVAEVGCGFGKVLFYLSTRNELIKELKGFDISPQAIAAAQKLKTKKVNFFLEDFTETETGNYDLVLVIDVIEHLENYFDLLEKIRSKSNYFIFHIPLDLSCRTLLKPHVVLQQRNDVGHLHYFSKEHIEWILKDTGYKIVDWVYTFPAIDRGKASNIKSKLKKLLRKISFSLSENLSAKLWGGYSLMILAVKDE